MWGRSVIIITQAVQCFAHLPRSDTTHQDSEWVYCSFRLPFLESWLSGPADSGGRLSFRAPSRSPCPGLQIVLPKPALRRLAVPSYHSPSPAAEPLRIVVAQAGTARARHSRPSWSEPRWWSAPGIDMGQTGSVVPARPCSLVQHAQSRARSSFPGRPLATCPPSSRLASSSLTNIKSCVLQENKLVRTRVQSLNKDTNSKYWTTGSK